MKDGLYELLREVYKVRRESIIYCLTAQKVRAIGVCSNPFSGDAVNRSRYAHSSIPAAVRSEKVSLHPPESYPFALGY